MVSFPAQFLFAISLLAPSVFAFSNGILSATTRNSELRMTWSLPSPPSMDSLSWYTVENHVTRRSLVYEDEPLEYKFASVGDDWPSMDDNRVVFVDGMSSTTATTNSVRRVNRFRRALRWARRSLRKS